MHSKWHKGFASKHEMFELKKTVFRAFPMYSVDAFETEWKVSDVGLHMHVLLYSALLHMEIHIARDTWMPSLENWDGGLKIFCG